MSDRNLSDFDAGRPEHPEPNEDEPLTITDDGMELPEKFAEASRLIIRTPTKTVDSRLQGNNTQRQMASMVRPKDYDPNYLSGDGRTAEIRNEECLPGDGVYRVGLLIAGGEQHWFPVEIQERDSDE